MVIALALVMVSVSPDVSMDVGYGRMITKAGKPSSELLRLRFGVDTGGIVSFKAGLIVDTPTVLPASLGLQGELSIQSLWAQAGVSHTSKRFVVSCGAGWYIFGGEVQLRENRDGFDIAVFAKVSFSIYKVFETLNDTRRLPR